MSIFKRYNSESQQWEPIASAPAAGVYTDNPILTTEEDTIVSVEDVLLQNHQDIDLLRKNVSWLAKHGGGGGTGSGGGIMGNDATIQIFDPADNTTDVSSFVWNNSYSILSYKISSNASTSTYTVSIKVDGVTKITVHGVKRNTTQTVSTNVLGLGKKDATIAIVAVDEAENEFTKTCKVTIASVILQNPSAVTYTQDIMQAGTPIVSLRYKVSIAGNYKLYFSDSNIFYDESLGWCDGKGALEDGATQRSQYIDILNSGTSYMNINVNLTNVYNSTDNIFQLISPNVAPGSYVRHFRLVKADNNGIYSSNVTAQVNVVTTDGMLVSPVVGVSEDTRYSVTADAILNLRFITYKGGVTTGTYEYRIFVGGTFNEMGEYLMDGVELSNLSNNGQVFGNTVSVPINITNYPEAFPDLGNYSIIIVASQYPVSASGVSYISVTKKTAEFVTAYKDAIDSAAIFDYTFWDTSNWNKENSNDAKIIQIDNHNFNYGDASLNGKTTHKSYLNLYNVGADSGLAAGNSVFYKMTHTAAGKITCDSSVRSRWFPKNIQDSESLVRGYDYNFSLQVAYSLEVEVDDDSTVFNMGNYDISTGLGYGVVITAHNYYVKIDNVTMTGVLQDNTFTQFDLVCSQKSGGLSRWIYIYQNGVLLQAAQHEPSSDAFSLHNIMDAYVACRSVSGNSSPANSVYPINVNLYAVRLYNIGLNDGQIVCSYINNYANYKRLSTGQVDADLLNNMMKNNLINADEYVYSDDPAKKQPISNVYDFNYGTYDWGVSSDGTTVNLGNLSDLPDRAGIPIVVLSTGWTYDQFIKTGADFDTNTQTQAGTFRYIYPGNPTGIIAPVTMNPQGTTTLGYTIKNLDVRFTGMLFSPKDTWFPEQVFTLKADVVDSAHINNAAIGTFVNDCVQLGITNNSHFPAKAKMDEYVKNRKTLPPNLTFKATIEGFPIVLIMDFSKEDGTRDPRVLGIYSFNLGRESYYNQGLEILTKLRNVNGIELAAADVTFPSLFGEPLESDLDNTYVSYCFEGSRSVNTTDSETSLDATIYDYAIVKASGMDTWYPLIYNINGFVGYDATHMIYDNLGNPIAWNSSNIKKMTVNHNGYFWSPDTTFSTSLWELKYFSKNSSQTAAWDQFGGISSNSGHCLANCIATKLPYRKGSVIRAIGGDGYKIWRITSAAGDAMETTDTGNTYAITRPQAQEPMELSVQNSAFYYVVCQLFGLIDNYGKNLQFKYWGKTGSETDATYKWSPTFYDMDTGLGVSNTGSEDVPPTTWEESIINLPDNRVRFMFNKAPNALNGYPKTGANPTFTVYSNKLWGSLEDPELHASYTITYGTSSDWRVYSKMWNDIRSKVFTNVDYFVEKYLTTSLSKCGEFIYNYDYYTKYLNTPQYSMLHGNRISFIRNWMTDRIAFLDSIFGYKLAIDNNNSAISMSTQYLTSTSIQPYSTPWNNAITIVHNSGSTTMPIKSNKSVIVKSIIGAKASSYKYIQKNTISDIIFSEGSGTQGVQTSINNSDCIIDLPNLHNISLTGITTTPQGSVKDANGTPVYDESFVSGGLASIYYQYGTLSSLKDFDISNISTINSNFDMFGIFKTWDESGWGGTPRAFALQNIDLSGTSSNLITANLSGVSSQDTTIPNIYRQPFTNLNTINISNSKVSSVNIPSGVTLQSLNIENSYITELKLNGQPLLSGLSFAKCSNLTSIELIKCNALSNISLDNTNIAIKNITISNCENIQSILIDGGNKFAVMPSISIEDCPNLKSIIIRNIRNTPTTEKIDNIRIINTPSLVTLEVSNCDYKTILWSGAELMKEFGDLNISNSSIGRIDLVDYVSSTDRNFINLKGFKSSTFVNEEGQVRLMAKNNQAITEVYFDNVTYVPTGETDVYGEKYLINVPDPFVLNMPECFAECKNLKRVYGYIHVAGDRIFNKCTSFSILGGLDAATKPSVNMYLSTKNTKGLEQTEITEGNHGDAIYPYKSISSDWVNSFTASYEYIHTHHPTMNYPSEPDSIYGAYYWNLLRVDENGNFRYAWICPKPTYDSETSTWIEPSDKYTNLMISGENVSGSFTETQCCSHEVYYTLFNCDSDNINISNLFSGCKNVSFVWSGNDNLDNSPNRHTFMNCTGATAASSVFAAGGLFKVYSPYIDEETGDIIPGTYTYLKDKCVSMSRIISGRGVMDNNVLRTLNKDKFAVINMAAFTASNFVNDVNGLDYNEYNSELSNLNYGGEIITGDVSNLLIDCPNITLLDEFLNDVDYINYDTACGDGSVKLPYITSIINSFRTNFASGNLKLNQLFDHSDCCEALTGIYSSFRCSSPIGEAATKLQFELTNDTFSNFPNLEIIGLDPEETGGEDPFTGLGLRKHIGSEGFPYDLFKHNTKLKEIIAFFQDCDFTDLATELYLPGDLFKYNTELTKTQRLFYNINIDPSKKHCVLTGNSFENCTKLKEVPYMFGCDASGSINAFMGSEIPAKLFYHGSTKATKTITGCNVEETIEDCTYITNGNKWTKGTYTYSGPLTVVEKETDEETGITTGKIIINPATNIINNVSGSNVKESLVPPGDSRIQTTTFIYQKPNNNITNMEGCFQGGDWTEYGTTDFAYNDEPEVNGDYSPYKYLLTNGSWSVNPVYNPSPKTYMWQYNGDWKTYNKFIETKGFNKDELEMLDDAYECVVENKRISRTIPQGSEVDTLAYPNIEMDMSINGNASTLELTGRFICAPDLLKYCSNNPNVRNLFNYCGPKSHKYAYCDTIRYGSEATTFHYGLKGRLVPYLLKPVPGLMSLNGMFVNCKFIGSYIKNDKVYPIPESFVKYLTSQAVDLTKTFSGWYYPAHTNLDVFKVTRNVSYTLTSTFEFPLFSNRICTSDNVYPESYVAYPATEVYGIFNDGTGYTKAGTIDGVFNAQESRGSNETSTTTIRNQSVRFSGVFAQGGYTGGTDMYCFSGYTDPTSENPIWGTRFPAKSVNTNDEIYRNYIVYNGPYLS